MKFEVTNRFWESFYELRPEQKESVRRAWAIFKLDPFDPKLRAHKIQKLSAQYRATIYSAVIEADLRSPFSHGWTYGNDSHRRNPLDL